MGGIALEKAVPLGRVWSFPKEIVVVNAPLHINKYRGNFAELLAPGIHQIFMEMLTEQEEYARTFSHIGDQDGNL